jgi:hypothetical protein
MLLSISIKGFLYLSRYIFYATYFLMGLGKKYELTPINIPPSTESNTPITIHLVVKRVDRYTPAVNIINPINKHAVTFFILSSNKAF